jgi:hypothetical protein
MQKIKSTREIQAMEDLAEHPKKTIKETVDFD